MLMFMIDEEDKLLQEAIKLSEKQTQDEDTEFKEELEMVKKQSEFDHNKKIESQLIFEEEFKKNAEIDRKRKQEEVRINQEQEIERNRIKLDEERQKKAEADARKKVLLQSLT